MCSWTVLLFFITLNIVVCEHYDLEFQIEEEVPEYTFVGNIKQKIGLTNSENVEFKLYKPTKSNHNKFFRYEVGTGVLRTNRPIDREEICKFLTRCVLTAYLTSTSYELFYTVTVKVDVKDINDNYPKFSSDSITIKISEDEQQGKSFNLPTAEDSDSGMLSVTGYELQPTSDLFELQNNAVAHGTTRLKLILRGSLDREKQEKYTFILLAFDGGVNRKSGKLILNITVLDANDKPPKFLSDIYRVKVNETLKVGETIVKVEATDEDILYNAKISYFFTEKTFKYYGSLFDIGRDSGEIILKSQLDRETKDSYNLVVIAKDGQNEAFTTVYITVEDANDSPPLIFVATLSSFSYAIVEENLSQDSPSNFFAHFTVEDGDIGSSGHVSCSINDTDTFELVTIPSDSFKIKTRKPVNREEKSRYFLKIVCFDHGLPPLNSSETLEVRVQDVNDHTPTFPNSIYKGSIKENLLSGTLIIKVQAWDADAGNNSKLTYSISGYESQYFEVNSNTGEIFSSRPFDRELKDFYRFKLTATDNGKPKKYSTTEIDITVEDQNDEAAYFDKQSYVFQVEESDRKLEYGKFREIDRVIARDADLKPYDSFHYEFALDFGTDHESFVIDRDTGKIMSKIALDREVQDAYYLVVVAVNDHTPLFTGSASVSIFVLDMNDNDPVITYPDDVNDTLQVSNQLPINYHVAKIEAKDDDANENSRLYYFLREENEYFKINPTSGEVRVKKSLSLVKDVETFKLSLIVQDSGDPPRNATGNLYVVVNKSIPFTFSSQTGEENVNKMIVITLAAVSSCLIVLLLLAIFSIRIHDSRRRARSRRIPTKIESHQPLTDKYDELLRIPVPAHHSAVNMVTSENRRNSAVEKQQEKRSTDYGGRQVWNPDVSKIFTLC
ncbi:unnamed protein product [Dimorphilus gyrociliatus]|uniref:Cadherin domain-containing protein n=1 Tax=Dimorphilus gyrociliatus TaxID=2664684 RepID=A0A7I8VV40_9ANNE|nr:unnamed protein product [Dimorphilus gyrociliatus]